MRFREFLETYNFRYVNDLGERYNLDTQTIRIYPDNEDKGRDYWFEFGVYDFGEEESKMGICESVLNKEIMESYVESISMNPDLEKVVTVYLRKKE